MLPRVCLFFIAAKYFLLFDVCLLLVDLKLTEFEKHKIAEEKVVG
jgi:hypothetical protein